jgi:hypothetical protein
VNWFSFFFPSHFLFSIFNFITTFFLPLFILSSISLLFSCYNPLLPFSFFFSLQISMCLALFCPTVLFLSQLSFSAYFFHSLILSSPFSPHLTLSFTPLLLLHITHYSLIIVPTHIHYTNPSYTSEVPDTSTLPHNKWNRS